MRVAASVASEAGGSFVVWRQGVSCIEPVKAKHGMDVRSILIVGIVVTTVPLFMLCRIFRKQCAIF
jgi:hypothetical protein